MIEHFFLEVTKENVQYLFSVTHQKYSFHSRFEIGLLQIPDFINLGKADFEYIENRFEERQLTIPEKHSDLVELLKTYLINRLEKPTEPD